MEENISYEEWLKKNLASRKNTKLTKAEKKEAQDRDIMRALKNFINARTPEYIVYTVGSGGTKNELTYLAGHSKQAGVDKETVWDCSREFLKYIFPDFGRPCFISYRRKKRSPLSSQPPADGPGRHKGAVFLYHQPYPSIRLDKGFRMRQNHRPNLLLRNWLLIPTLIKATLIDFTSDLVSLHTLI